MKGEYSKGDPKKLNESIYISFQKMDLLQQVLEHLEDFLYSDGNLTDLKFSFERFVKFERSEKCNHKWLTSETDKNFARCVSCGITDRI